MRIISATTIGHGGVFFGISWSDGSQHILAIDPWLTGNPACPADFANPKQLDSIVVTHGHADHASDVVRLAKQLGSTIYCNWELAEIFKRAGVSEHQLVAMNKGGTVKWGQGYIALTNAFHSNSYDTSDGPVYAGEACGCIINDGTRSIYHTGDTTLFSDMKLIGEFHRPEIAFVCIGDRFTMGPVEAARAVELIGCKVVVPIHHSTFDLLTGTPEQFKAACKNLDVDVRELAPGDSFKFQ